MKKQFLILFLFLVTTTLRSQPNQWQWAFDSYCQHPDQIEDVSFDTYGNSYLVGNYASDTFQLSNVTLLWDSANNGNTFIIKMDPSGNVLWSKQIGCGANIKCIKIGANNDIQIAGEFTADTLIIDAFTLPSSQTWNNDVFVCVMDSSGNVRWVNRFGSVQGNDFVTDIVSDPSGNVYVLGYFEGSQLTIGNNSLLNNGQSNFYLARFNSNGQADWIRGAAPGSDCYSKSLSMDAAGFIYVTCNFTGALQIGQFFNSGDVFIAKYDLLGTAHWVKSFGNIILNMKAKVYDDIIYLGGEFKSYDAHFDSVQIDNNHDSINCLNIFVVRMDTSGSVQWGRSFGGIGDDYLYEMDVDGEGNLYFAGEIVEDVVFGNYPMTLSSYVNLYLAGIDPSGNIFYADNIESAYQNNCYGVKCDPFNNVYMVGRIIADAQFGNIHLLSTNSFTDAFVAKLSGAPLSVSSDVFQSSVNVYPVPSSGMFNVLLEGKYEYLMLYDSMGKLVYSGNVKGVLEKTIAIQTSGMYKLQLISSHGTESKSVLVTR